MQTITKYCQITTIRTDFQAYLIAEFKLLYTLYNEGMLLEEYEISEFGEFVLIENVSELYDLSPLSYSSILTETIEFVCKYTVNSMTFYDLYILHDTDSGTRFLTVDTCDIV